MRISVGFEDQPSLPMMKKSMGQPPQEKGVSVRKQMAMKEPPMKRPESPKRLQKSLMPPLAPPGPKIPQGQVVLDKFGNFRLMTPPEMKKGKEGGGAVGVGGGLGGPIAG